jgi:hypothetical protein
MRCFIFWLLGFVAGAGAATATCAYVWTADLSKLKADWRAATAASRQLYRSVVSRGMAGRQTDLAGDPD